jgi:hypothetical protein
MTERSILVTTQAIPNGDPEIADTPASSIQTSISIQPTGERMQELARIKHLLTETEYVQKQEDNIASV